MSCRSAFATLRSTARAPTSWRHPESGHLRKQIGNQLSRCSMSGCRLTLRANSKFRSFWPRALKRRRSRLRFAAVGIFPSEFSTRLGFLVVGSTRFDGCRKINPESGGGPIDISYRDYLKNWLQHKYSKVGCQGRWAGAVFGGSFTLSLVNFRA